MKTAPLERAHALATRYAELPDVVAVALSGSQTAGVADEASDLDLYVYARQEPDLDARRRLAGPNAEIGNRFFEPGDEWREPDGVGIDVMFRDPAWIEGQLERVLVRHEASVGYSTCFWHNVATSVPIVDATGWLAGLRRICDVDYPEPLRAAIVARNHPLLRRNQSSFLHQLERASARGDRVAANHRAGAFLASFFDVLFALNRLPHPGEKRLVAIAEARCPKRPPGLDETIAAFLSGGAGRAGDLIDALDELLAADGLL